MDGPRSPVTMTATAKKTMSRSFLIDSLIGSVKRPAHIAAGAEAANAAAATMPYHPQLNEYIQFLNRTAVAAAAYGYHQQSPATTIVGPRFFGYPIAGGAGEFARDRHQGNHQSPAVIKPVPMLVTGTTGQRTKHHHQNHHHQTKTSKKRTADELTAFDPGKSKVHVTRFPELHSGSS